MKQRLLWTRIVLMVLVVFQTPFSMADPQSDRRLMVGTRQFPALVAADLDLHTKRAHDGRLHLVVLYCNDRQRALEVAKRLEGGGHIKNSPLWLTVLPYHRLREMATTPPAALFMAEQSPGDREQVMQFGIQHQRLVFSPFEKDVEEGVMSGMYVYDRILPMFNETSLAASGVRLNSLTLAIGKFHRP